MLKTSPIITNTASPSTSPASFRHATARSHVHTFAHTSSSPAPAAGSGSGAPPIARRSSSQSRSAASSKSASLTTSASASMKSPQAMRSSARNASQDQAAASDDRGAGPNAGDRQIPQPTPTEPPLSPRPQPMTKTSDAIPSSVPSQTNLAASDAQAAATLSPNKRRGSPSQLTEQTASATAAENAGKISPKSTKRAKPDTTPPKVLPIKYELCAVEDIVELIACMLAELITTNDAIRLSSAVLTRFHSRTPPGISVRDYLHRLARHATLTPPLLLAMVYYIDRLCAMYQEFTINTLTVHRFLITAATVAAKGLSDSFWNNATYARVGGVRIQELKLLELEFLHRVDWMIVPNPEVLVAYYNGLVERTAGYTLESSGSSDQEPIADDSDELEESPRD